ncbi:MAG: hypothetical protein ACI8XQ_000921, partial [Bermanella sp.]
MPETRLTAVTEETKLLQLAEKIKAWGAELGFQ